MLLRNPISLAGMALAIVSLANIFLFVVIDAIAIKPSPYIGILAYMVSPGFLVLGLLLMFGRDAGGTPKEAAPVRLSPHRPQRSNPAKRRRFLWDIPDRVHHREHCR